MLLTGDPLDLRAAYTYLYEEELWLACKSQTSISSERSPQLINTVWMVTRKQVVTAHAMGQHSHAETVSIREVLSAY